MHRVCDVCVRERDREREWMWKFERPLIRSHPMTKIIFSYLCVYVTYYKHTHTHSLNNRGEFLRLYRHSLWLYFIVSYVRTSIEIVVVREIRWNGRFSMNQVELSMCIAVCSVLSVRLYIDECVMWICWFEEEEKSLYSDFKVVLVCL